MPMPTGRARRNGDRLAPPCAWRTGPRAAHGHSNRRADDGQSAARRSGQSGLRPPPPEIEEQAVHELMDRQYRKTLDQPVGMLGDKSPRQAVKTAAGRRKVADWHKYLENQTARQLDPTDPRRPTASSGCGRSSACSIFANSSCPVADVVGLHRIRSYVYAVASHTCRDDVQSWLKNGRRADRAQVRSAPKGDIND